MSKIRRPKTTGAVFITIVTAKRLPWLTNAEALECFHKEFPGSLERYEWEAIAWVLMPDHLHWLVKPRQPEGLPLAEGADYSRLVRGFKESMTRAMRTIFPDGPIWQNRYWEHCIRDGQDYQNHFDYIHWNPVKHGLCQSPVQWPHSSFHSYHEQGWYAGLWKPDEKALKQWDKDDMGE